MFSNETLIFFQNILKNMQIHAAYLNEPYTDSESFDYGIRHIAFPTLDYVEYTKNFCQSRQPGIVYKAFDEFLFNYIIMKIPESDTCFVIGPYTLQHFSDTEILNKAQEFVIPPNLFPAFKNCYGRVPFIPDSSMFMSLIHSFASQLYGGMDSFTVKELIGLCPSEDLLSHLNSNIDTPDELFFTMKQIEAKYDAENELLQTISHGHLHKIEMYFHHINLTSAAQRLADPVRNAKNYAIITNTLFRKAAEQGAVHPIHLDRISSEFAKKIEIQTSEKGVASLIREMARKYTLTVKNHSLKGYSPLVRRVLVHIDADLSADLSLSTQAKLLDVNPNYLSGLFKKETGSTLTEYVTQKRMEHAVFLLNSTRMQIQTIAGYCGIPDICYFTKTFKKVIGKTPSEYRHTILKTR